MSQEYSQCFACGEDNPIGLKLKFELSDGKYSTTFTPLPEHQSYSGRVHGGLIATLLDETMGDYIYKLAGKPSFTARLELRYRQAVPIGKPVKVVAQIIRQKGRMYDTKGELFLSDGSLAVEATGRILLHEEKRT